MLDFVISAAKGLLDTGLASLLRRADGSGEHQQRPADGLCAEHGHCPQAQQVSGQTASMEDLAAPRAGERDLRQLSDPELEQLAGALAGASREELCATLEAARAAAHTRAASTRRRGSGPATGGAGDAEADATAARAALLLRGRKESGKAWLQRQQQQRQQQQQQQQQPSTEHLQEREQHAPAPGNFSQVPHAA